MTELEIKHILTLLRKAQKEIDKKIEGEKNQFQRTVLCSDYSRLFAAEKVIEIYFKL